MAYKQDTETHQQIFFMTIKNNPSRRLGRLFNHARNHQNLSLFEISKKIDVAIQKLISIEEARMQFYDANLDEALIIVKTYAQFLDVDAQSLIHDISKKNRGLI